MLILMRISTYRSSISIGLQFLSRTPLYNDFVVTSIFPDGKILRPRLAVFAFRRLKQKHRCAFQKLKISRGGDFLNALWTLVSHF